MIREPSECGAINDCGLQPDSNHVVRDRRFFLEPGQKCQFKVPLTDPFTPNNTAVYNVSVDLVSPGLFLF